MLGIAVLFYQLHGIGFTWPTTEGFKQTSYDFMHRLRESPLFWTAAGGSMLALIVLGLYKKSVFDQKNREIRQRSIVDERVNRVIRSLTLDEAEALYGKINLLLTHYSYFDLRTMPKPSTGDYHDELIKFLRSSPSFFRICFLLSHIQGFGAKIEDLTFIYSIRHLLAMLESKDISTIKTYFSVPANTDLAAYLLVKWKAETAEVSIRQLLENESIVFAITPHGKIILKSIIGAMQRWFQTNRTLASLVEGRIEQVNRLYAVIKFLNKNVIKVSKQILSMMRDILSDQWVRLQDTGLQITLYEDARDAVVEYQKVGKSEQNFDKYQVFYNAVKFLEYVAAEKLKKKE